MMDIIKLLDPRNMYVIKTNKGYVGEPVLNEFNLVDKNHSRRFTVDELKDIFDTIKTRMFCDHDCSSVRFEITNKLDVPDPEMSDIQSILYNSIYEIIVDWDIKVGRFSDKGNGNMGYAKIILDHLNKRLPWLRNGSVRIDLNNPNEFDKFSGGYFTCPKCKFRHLLEAFNHCPKCGIGLDFIK